ncbi:zinc finger protein 530-like [Ylistrum balloti]|uniref:zinc finger protein 530-like n=1 Tax=Ylistrum balloti TaxID=509963 RepID=UPI002905F3E4|nr:zinc finger protein 530-like [Ylistrum balloti]
MTTSPPSDAMAMTVSENSFTGSLDGSDGNQSGGSESYAMYLTVGDAGYGVSTTVYGSIDPGEDADTEDEGQICNTSLNKEQNETTDVEASINTSHTKETCKKPSEGDILCVPDTLEARKYPNNIQCSATGVDGKSTSNLHDSGDNTSDTENYSINSDDNQQTNNTDLVDDYEGHSVDNEHVNHDNSNTALSVSVKTEPESPVDSDSSTGHQAVNHIAPGSGQDANTNFSPSKAFSLRLNLFQNKPAPEREKFDFETLDNVIAAAVSKTYNKETNLNASGTIPSKNKGKLQEAFPKKVIKSAEEARSGVVVVDEPIYIEGKLFHGCSVCHKMFKTPKELRVHSRIHTKEKPYSCYVCGKSFRQQAHLNSHYKIHSGEKPYSCNLCSLSFTENSSLKRHIRIHLGIKPYKCDLCDDAFVTSYLLKTHKTRRHEEKQNRTRFVCDLCPKIYTSKETFNKHMRSHNPDTRISCSYCGQVCLTTSHLKRHINVHTRTDLCNLQTKDKPYECGICQKKYFNKKHLELHVVRHTQTENFSCDTCDKSFDTRYKWKRHVRRSHFEKNGETTCEPNLYNCLLCNKVFRTNDSLESHIKRTHEKPMIYNCDLCERTFLRRDAMLNHKESHLGQTFQCSLCDRNYSTSMTLKSHMRKKHGKKDDRRSTGKILSEIICEFCHRAFCNKASLKEHVRTRHSDNIQLFTCSLCQMKFTRRNSLQRHMKKSCRMLNPDHQNLDIINEFSDDDTSPDIDQGMDEDMDSEVQGADMDTSLNTPGADKSDDECSDTDIDPDYVQKDDLDTTCHQTNSSTFILKQTPDNGHHHDESVLSRQENKMEDEPVSNFTQQSSHQDSSKGITGDCLVDSSDTCPSPEKYPDAPPDSSDTCPSPEKYPNVPPYSSDTCPSPEKHPNALISPGASFT